MSKSLPHSAPVRRLPSAPNLEQLKNQAKELLENFRSGEAAAIAEVRQYERGPHPENFALKIQTWGRTGRPGNCAFGGTSSPAGCACGA